MKEGIDAYKIIRSGDLDVDVLAIKHYCVSAVIAADSGWSVIGVFLKEDDAIAFMRSCEHIPYVDGVTCQHIPMSMIMNEIENQAIRKISTILGKFQLSQ